MTETPRDATPEIDDSQNPTMASPVSSTTSPGSSGGAGSAGGTSPRAETSAPGDDVGWRGRSAAGGAQMIDQLQSMIDNLSQQAAPVVRQATPVLRQVAAKAAELAALAAERAGPLAQRAADVTQDVGVKVAARSREVASDLRRGEQSESVSVGGDAPARPSSSGTGSSARPNQETERPPTTPGL